MSVNLLVVFQAEVLSRELDPYIRNLEGNEGPGDGGAALHNEQMRLWPLIKYVQVTLPASDFVPEGVVFVDIPGTGDSNKKRDEMWKEVTGRWDQCGGGGEPSGLFSREAAKRPGAGGKGKKPQPSR